MTFYLVMFRGTGGKWGRSNTLGQPYDTRLAAEKAMARLGLTPSMGYRIRKFVAVNEEQVNGEARFV